MTAQDSHNGARPRVLIIGLDGATFDLIKPWVAEGRLPTFKRLMEQGSWGELQVELPPGTVPNWPSFATGKNPGKHGLIWWVKPDPKSDDYTVISSADLRGQTIWDIAGQQGLKVGVVNVPVTYPPHEVNGFLITGLLTPPNATSFTYPVELAQEMEEQVGRYRVFPEQLYRDGNEEAYLADLHRTLEARLKSVQYLMAHKPWSLFAVVFGATDWVMHAFWKYHDPSHPDYNPEMGQRFGQAIRSIYEHADQVLQSLLDSVDERTSVIIMSDHGAGPAWARSMINNWLLEIGLLKLKRSPLTWLKYASWRLGFTQENIYPLVARLGLVSMKAKKKVDPRRMGRKSLVRKVFLSYNDVDWARTKAFTLGGMGQIHINVKGRSPRGCVEPGAEYDRVRDIILERVSEIRLPLPGSPPFVARAYKREELFHGEHEELMPDILLLPADLRFMDSGLEFASNRLFAPLGGVSGAHRTNGVLVIYGANMVGGQELKNVSIRDIAPTALHLLGLPVPDDMDGRVVVEALSPAYMQAHPVQKVTAQKGGTNGKKDGFGSDLEEELVRQRLAGLGYLD